jgi:hypothetical protein
MEKTLRHELKYAINNLEYACLKSRLKPLIYADEHVLENGEYHIRSVYFDDWSDSAYNEKEAGDFQRAKYRIRIYNKEANLIRLELKEKFSNVTAKSSRIITRELYDQIMNRRLTLALLQNDPFLTDFYLAVKTKGLEPKVIVDYVREPYIHRFGNVRITFDKRLQAGINSTDIFNPSLLLTSPIQPGSMILEVKYDDLFPTFIHRNLDLSSHQQLAISKYTMCRSLKNALDWKEAIL